MFCENCGSTVSYDNTTCPTCGMPITASRNTSGAAPVKTTGLLIFCILTLFLCAPFGIIGLIMYFRSLQNAINSGDMALIQKKKKSITTLLIIGIVLGVLLPLLVIFLIAIPNFSGIQNRMEIRADISTAAQIGKATRLWFTDATTDMKLKELYNEEDLIDGFVRIDRVERLDEYLDTSLTPRSYQPNRRRAPVDAAYYVHVANGISSDSQVIVAIGPETLSNTDDDMLKEIFYEDLEEPIETNYDGSASGIAYVEP